MFKAIMAEVLISPLPVEGFQLMKRPSQSLSISHQGKKKKTTRRFGCCIAYLPTT
jgi:hypothetical protein